MSEDRLHYKLKRIEKKIKLIDVANAIGLSAGTVSRYENDKREMTDEHVESYKKYINGR